MPQLEAHTPQQKIPHASMKRSRALQLRPNAAKKIIKAEINKRKNSLERINKSTHLFSKNNNISNGSFSKDLIQNYHMMQQFRF